MNNVIITQLDPVKVPLVKRFYKEHYPTGKANKSELIYSLLLDNELCGVVRFRTIEDSRLLTGMAISKQHRGKQLGSQLMEYCEQHTLTEKDYCFTYVHLINFYTRHQFIQIDPKQLPNGLRVLYERYSNSGKDLIPMHYQQNC
ncbi:GNAT family N-acetyltransferase [Vibrio cyclitrophicus]|uniref:GNAT family N-acetyltransferase n=1 Tax=Vibrio cyclitrophicus TaxID=47951 RepID=UPI000C8445DA|nr:GNAT family N-acetyltransferase [Vibrio cyclitrophicus]PME40088.1 GNAT family N-acetyltransferase [Vibrio cyclitrophicus]PME53330.1 GNAT family N-acetyltransferase [Vibrio cyclitrophicus]PMF36624.1 GNAT family N-acetyltransferase [Vibrio cyclitrophicus]